MDSGDTWHVEAILDSFKVKSKKKTEEPSEGDEVKTEDLSDMPPLGGDEEQVKSKPEETIAERVKLNPWKRKK